MPKEGVLESAPWMFDDWWGDRQAMALPLPQRAVYFEALSLCLKHGKLPDDDLWCAQTVHISLRSWRQLLPKVIHFFYPVECGWQHKKVDKIRSKKLEVKDIKSKAGKKGNATRWSVQDRICDSTSDRSRTRSLTLTPAPTPHMRSSDNKNEVPASSPSDNRKPLASELARPLSPEEWARPDPGQLAFEVAQRRCPKHWCPSDIRLAAGKLMPLFAKAVNPDRDAAAIERKHEAWCKRKDKLEQWIKKKQFAFWIADELYLQDPPADPFEEELQQILELERLEEENEKKELEAKRRGAGHQGNSGADPVRKLR